MFGFGQHHENLCFVACSFFLFGEMRLYHLFHMGTLTTQYDGTTFFTKCRDMPVVSLHVNTISHGSHRNHVFVPDHRADVTFKLLDTTKPLEPQVTLPSNHSERSAVSDLKTLPSPPLKIVHHFLAFHAKFVTLSAFFDPCSRGGLDEGFYVNLC